MSHTSRSHTPAADKATRTVRAPAPAQIRTVPRATSNQALLRGAGWPTAPRQPASLSSLGQPGDRFERDADRLAALALLTPGPTPSAVPPDLPALPRRDRKLRAPGRPLDDASLAYFEHRLGMRLDEVRIHSGDAAAKSAAAAGANAFTLGNDIVFASESYSPDSPAGQALLAHELAHVALAHPGLHRQVAGAPQLTTGPFQLTGTDAANLAEVMAAVDAIEPGGLGDYYTRFKGTEIRMDQAQRDQLVAGARSALRKALGKVTRDIDMARTGLKLQQQTNDEFPITSFFVRGFAGVGDIPEALGISASRAQMQVATARQLAADGKFVAAAKLLADAEKAAKRAVRLEYEYRDRIIGTGESTITVLEYTRDASFITLGVLAIIATGGAAAGGLGSTTTVLGIEGVSTAVAANTIATAAPIVATLGGVGMQVYLDEPVDWGRVGVDLAVNLVLAKFGGRLSQVLFTRLAGRAAVASVNKIVFGRIVSSLVMHEASVLFTTAADNTYRALRYKNVTWGGFVNELADRLSDPKGLFVATLMGAIQAGADVRLGGAHGTEFYDDRESPTGEFDLIRAGTIYEDKSVRGLNKIDPRTGQRFPSSDTEESWAQDSIFNDTVKELASLKVAQGTRPVKSSRTTAGGSRAFPTVDELRTLRKYVFVIEADSPALRAAVAKQIAALNQHFKKQRWQFSAQFGARPRQR